MFILGVDRVKLKNIIKVEYVMQIHNDYEVAFTYKHQYHLPLLGRLEEKEYRFKVVFMPYYKGNKYIPKKITCYERFEYRKNTTQYIAGDEIPDTVKMNVYQVLDAHPYVKGILRLKSSDSKSKLQREWYKSKKEFEAKLTDYKPSNTYALKKWRDKILAEGKEIPFREPKRNPPHVVIRKHFWNFLWVGLNEDSTDEEMFDIDGEDPELDDEMRTIV